MLPGESPLAFFLRTQANDKIKETAKQAQSAETQQKDAFWKAGDDENSASSRVDFLRSGVSVLQVEGKGRGLISSDVIPAGSVVLREKALVAAVGSQQDSDMPMLPAIRLTAAILTAGVEASTRSLEPRLGRETAEHPVRTARDEELKSAVALVRERCPQASAILDDEALQRLVLAVSLNAHGVNLRGGGEGVHHGLFVEVGAMINHSCRPNAIIQGVGIQGSDGEHDALQLVLQTVSDVKAGEELCISYLNELYLPFPERDERLRDMHAFGAEQLSSDRGLEAMSASAAALSSAERAQLLQRVIKCNELAFATWEKAMTHRAGYADADQQALCRKMKSASAQNYAALLNTNLLAETHAWRYNASWRLAALLSEDGPPKACAQSLQLWECAIRSGLLVWPSVNWPEHRRLLRGALQAALGAGDKDKEESLSRQLKEIEDCMSVSF